jgi:pimeloyl-ACP methyl ester carboxylesterase
MESGTVTEWLSAEGDGVKAGDPLFVAETDKAAHDVEAPCDGVLRRIVAEAGATLPVRGPVAVLTEPGESLTDEEVDEFLAQQAAAARPSAAVAKASARQSVRPRPAERDQRGRVRASPAARKLAGELGLDLQTVTATGPGGRITSEDVQRAADADDDPVRQDWATLDDGRRIFYILAGKRDASPIVFVHGLAGSSSTWQMVLETFAETHQVLALDLPGHGQSDASEPAAIDYSISGLAQVVATVMRSLAVSDATLVGHSLGGAVAAAVALEEPELVSRLVLVDSVGLGREINPQLIELVNGPPSAASARELLELFFHDEGFVLDSGVDEYHLAWARPGAEAAIRAVADGAFNNSSQEVTLALDRVNQPVLVVWGGEDRVIPVNHADAARNANPSPTVSILPGSGHVPQIEAASEFAAGVERFISDADGTRR